MATVVVNALVLPLNAKSVVVGLRHSLDKSGEIESACVVETDDDSAGYAATILNNHPVHWWFAKRFSLAAGPDETVAISAAELSGMTMDQIRTIQNWADSVVGVVRKTVAEALEAEMKDAQAGPDLPPRNRIGTNKGGGPKYDRYS